MQVHAHVLYEPRIGGGDGGGRRGLPRRYVPHPALVRRLSAAVADQPLTVGGERQRRVEPTVAARVPHRHDPRLGAVDQYNVGRTPPGADAQPQSDVGQRAVVGVREHPQRVHVVVVQQPGLDAVPALVDGRPVHRRAAHPRPHRAVPAHADVHGVTATVAVDDRRRAGVLLTPPNFVDAAATHVCVINHVGN